MSLLTMSGRLINVSKHPKETVMVKTSAAKIRFRS